MTPLDTLTSHTTELTTDGTHDGDTVTFYLVGEADLVSSGPLAEVLGRLHEEAVRLGAATVRLDFRALEFASSSCLKCLITWIDVASQAADKYRIVLVATESFPWQQRSLPALQCCAPDMISIEMSKGGSRR